MNKPSIKNFWEPTPKKLKRLAWSIKALTASTGLTALASGYTWLAVCIAIVGGVADFVIEFFKEEQ